MAGLNEVKGSGTARDEMRKGVIAGIVLTSRKGEIPPFSLILTKPELFTKSHRQGTKIAKKK